MKRPTEADRAVKEALLEGMNPGDILDCYAIYNGFGWTRQKSIGAVYLFESDAEEDRPVGNVDKVLPVRIIMGADKRLYASEKRYAPGSIVRASEPEKRRRIMAALSEDQKITLGLINPDRYRDHP